MLTKNVRPQMTGDYWEEAALGAGIATTLYELLKIGITLYTGVPVY